jgi:Flp pilus assembly pilin Flp
MRRLAALRDNEDGATIVEFGMVVPILAITTMGLFELGYNMYVGSAVQGALHEAARLATVGDVAGAEIDTRVRERLAPFTHEGTRISLTTESYADFAGVKKPEKITQDTVPLGQYNVGDCYEDANNNGRFDLDRGRTGLGQADDIVNYTISMTYNRLFPVAGLLGWSDTQTIEQSTVLRNQPYAARSTAVTVRCN